GKLEDEPYDLVHRAHEPLVGLDADLNALHRAWRAEYVLVGASAALVDRLRHRACSWAPNGRAVYHQPVRRATAAHVNLDLLHIVLPRRPVHGDGSGGSRRVFLFPAVSKEGTQAISERCEKKCAR